MPEDLVFRDDVLCPEEMDGEETGGFLPRSAIHPALSGAAVAAIVAALVAEGGRESFVSAPAGAGLWKRAALLDQMGAWGP